MSHGTCRTKVQQHPASTLCPVGGRLRSLPSCCFPRFGSKPPHQLRDTHNPKIESRWVFVVFWTHKCSLAAKFVAGSVLFVVPRVGHSSVPDQGLRMFSGLLSHYRVSLLTRCYCSDSAAIHVGSFPQTFSSSVWSVARCDPRLYCSRRASSAALHAWRVGYHSCTRSLTFCFSCCFIAAVVVTTPAWATLLGVAARRAVLEVAAWPSLLGVCFVFTTTISSSSSSSLDTCTAGSSVLLFLPSGGDPSGVSPLLRRFFVIVLFGSSVVAEAPAALGGEGSAGSAFFRFVPPPRSALPSQSILSAACWSASARLDLPVCAPCVSSSARSLNSVRTYVNNTSTLLRHEWFVGGTCFPRSSRH